MHSSQSILCISLSLSLIFSHCRTRIGIAMARTIAHTLTLARQGHRVSTTTTTATQSLSPLSRLLPHRTQSNHSSSSSSFTDLTDIDSSSSNADPLIRKLEDAIHRIIVRRSAPDWLPFVPGSSYWVPPPRSSSNALPQLLHKLANPSSTHDPSMSLTNLPSWPSSSYFIQGAAAPHPVEMETTSDCDSQSEDEEG